MKESIEVVIDSKPYAPKSNKFMLNIASIEIFVKMNKSIYVA